jgi:hypothetical protein
MSNKHQEDSLKVSTCDRENISPPIVYLPVVVKLEGAEVDNETHQEPPFNENHESTFEMSNDPEELPESPPFEHMGSELVDDPTPIPDDQNSYDLWVNDTDYVAEDGASFDQQYYYDEDQAYAGYYAQEPDPYDHEEYQYEPADAIGVSSDSPFDDTFFGAPSLQVLQIDQSTAEEDDLQPSRSRPPRPHKRIPNTCFPKQEETDNHWAWSSSPENALQGTRPIRSAYSSSSNHLSPHQPTSRPQTADALRPLHLTDTVDDGDDEPYEISLSTPSILLPRGSSPSPSLTNRAVTSHLKRPHSLPTGLRA